MFALWGRFWRDERGFVGVEWAFVTTLLVLGAITGAVALRQAELEHTDPPAQVGTPFSDQ
jgi:Flp pilus assembly pilin Flp